MQRIQLIWLNCALCEVRAFNKASASSSWLSCSAICLTRAGYVTTVPTIMNPPWPHGQMLDWLHKQLHLVENIAVGQTSYEVMLDDAMDVLGCIGLASRWMSTSRLSFEWFHSFASTESYSKTSVVMMMIVHLHMHAGWFLPVHIYKYIQILMIYY